MRLRLGTCRLEANEVEIRSEGRRWTLEGEQVCLAQGKLRVWANRLRLGPGGALRASQLHGAPCACGVGRWLTFSARSARVEPGGRRLHLSWPTLRIGGAPVLVAPYLPLPLGPGVSGLLPPELGYSGRDGIRLDQGIYLALAERADLLLAGGWVEERGARGRIRARVAGRRGEAELRLVGLQDGERYRGAAAGRAHVVGEGWAAGLAPDLVSDAGLVADLEQDADRVFAPHLRSRLWGASAWEGLQVRVLGDLLQDLGLPQHDPGGLHGIVAVGIALAPTAVVGPLLFRLDGGLAQWVEPGRVDLERQARLVHLAPALGVAAAAGPLRFSGEVEYRLLALGRQREEVWEPLFHALLLGAETSLPLARRYEGSGTALSHVVEPALGCDFGAGGGDPGPLPDGIEARDGGLAHLGVRTALLARPAAGAVRRVLAAQVRLELAFPEEVTPRIGADVQLSPSRFFDAWARVRWDLPGTEEDRLAETQARLCVHAGPLSLCGGYARLRLHHLAQLFDPAGPAAWSTWGGVALPLAAAADEAFGSVRLDGASFGLFGRAAVDPRVGRFAHAHYGAELRLGCGCYRVGLVGYSRSGQTLPDLVARLAIEPGAGPGCGQ